MTDTNLLKRSYAHPAEHCKHEQVNPRSEEQHPNVGGNCAICKSPLSKAFVKDVDGKLVYEELAYVAPVGKSRKRRKAEL